MTENRTLALFGASAARGRHRRGIAEHLRSPYRLSRADLARAVLDPLDDPATFRK